MEYTHMIHTWCHRAVCHCSRPYISKNNIIGDIIGRTYRYCSVHLEIYLYLFACILSCSGTRYNIILFSWTCAISSYLILYAHRSIPTRIIHGSYRLLDTSWLILKVNTKLRCHSSILDVPKRRALLWTVLKWT